MSWSAVTGSRDQQPMQWRMIEGSEMREVIERLRRAFADRAFRLSDPFVDTDEGASEINDRGGKCHICCRRMGDHVSTTR